MADQRRCRGLSICPRYRDDRRPSGFRAVGTNFAGEQLDISDDFDTGIFGRDDDIVRRRMGERNSGAQYERLYLVPRPFCERPDHRTLALCRRAIVFLVVPRKDTGAAFHQRLHRRDAGPRQSEDGDVSFCEGG